MITPLTFPTFPATAGDAELVFEAVPDFEQTSVELEICALRIRDVGDGLACMLHKNPLAITQLSKSPASRSRGLSKTLEVTIQEFLVQQIVVVAPLKAALWRIATSFEHLHLAK